MGGTEPSDPGTAPCCCTKALHQLHPPEPLLGLSWGEEGLAVRGEGELPGQRGSFLVTHRTWGFVLPVALHALHHLVPLVRPRTVTNALLFPAGKLQLKCPSSRCLLGSVRAQLMYRPGLDSPRCAASQDQGEGAGAPFALSQRCPSKPQQGREMSPALPMHRAPCPPPAPSGPEISVRGCCGSCRTPWVPAVPLCPQPLPSSRRIYTSPLWGHLPGATTASPAVRTNPGTGWGLRLTARVYKAELLFLFIF